VSGAEVLYFAFGANMCASVLERRSVQVTDSYAGTLEDHRLVFDLPGIPWIEPVFANIAPTPGATVHGVLHAMTRPDFDRLSRSEGAGRHYRCIEVSVKPLNGDEPQIAMAFEAMRRVQGLNPSRRYVDLLLEGARTHGLPQSYIAALEAQPCVDFPGARRLMPKVLKGFDVLFQAGMAPERLLDGLWGLYRKMTGTTRDHDQ